METIAFLDENNNSQGVDANNPLPVTITDALGPQAGVQSTSVVPATDAAFALKAPNVNAFVNAPSVYASAAAEVGNANPVKVGAGVLYGLDGYNAKGSAQFILIFDKASAPADGDIPIYALTAATVANFGKDFGVYGLRFQKGLSFSNSSTVATRTVGSADCQFFARYK